MSKKKRLQQVLQGKVLERPLITAYRHVPQRERSAEDLAANTLEQYRKYDWDIIKVHPAATVANEVWGNVYDYSKYEQGIFPTLVTKAIDGLDELPKFVKMPGDTAALGDMIEAVKLIKAELADDDVPVLMTLFTPINYICDALGAPVVRRHFPADRNENIMFELFKTHTDVIKTALENITDTFVDYVHKVMDAGADGFFHAEIGWARAGYMEKSEWEEWVKPYDLKILNAIREKGGVVMFHTCGMKSNPEWFVDLPIDILHWDQGAEGNPPLENSDQWLKGMIPMGGVDEMLFGNDKAEEIREATLKTVRANRDLAYILAPYCSISPDSSDEEIFAFRRARDEA